MTDKEIIKRIEMAPIEVQTMVAKAFIREDIDNENVQYLFNTDTLDELNDPNEKQEIENVNAEAPQGIGAGMFSMRTSKPSKNKNFITTGAGGWNTCIKGYPTDPNANVLANCVGYASGRFNEIINEARGTTGCTYKYLNCNAEWFIERAVQAGLKTGSTPRTGAIMCWRKGTVDGGQDGAGHVCIVEKVYDNGHVLTSESGYGSTAFWNQHRYSSNGRWGLNAPYTFRAFIYLPDDVQKIVDGPTPEPEPSPTPVPTPTGKFKIGDKVIINGPLYVSSNAVNSSNYISNRITTITRYVAGTKHPYNTTGDLGWMDESSITKYEEPKPTPTPQPTPTPSAGLKVGDKVKIVGTGNGSSYGTSNTAYGIGWTRQVLGIYSDRAYPYRVGNSTGTTGFYKASALQKL